MNTFNIFGHTLYTTHCDHSDYYTNKDLAYSVDKIFSLPEIQNRTRGAKWDSHYGEGETSEILPSLGPANVPGGEQITAWVMEQCSQVLGKPVQVNRSWMNRLNTGSQGRCHRHVAMGQSGLDITPDLVAIFYVNNPPGGSKLVIVDQGVAGELPSNIPETNKQYIEPKTGDLIMHGADVWHAVSEHCAEEPRICFVYQLVDKLVK